MVGYMMARVYSYVALELPASAHGMAAMLALHPEVVAHVLHRDK